ncbi:MAG: arginine deiminase-related protein [Bacteroidetes bacterium]|nr:arginine deiminase-related protein [Bacteroidota bacterium]
MPQQSTSHILMVRPATFRKNEETAGNNHYQKDADVEDVHQQALDEFDGMVDDLRARGVDVLVVEDDPSTDTPDALFPNNWVSFHADGRVGLYPMFAPNRRLERREDILHDLVHSQGFDLDEVVDFTEFEAHEAYLEGTGSMVLDRIHGKAYAALSPRTDRNAFEQWCESMDVEGVVFEAMQTVGVDRLPIYHTNVMMAIGTGWAVVCLDCVDHADDRTLLRDSLEADGLTVIPLSEAQINRFAGNMLEVQTRAGDKLIVMSQNAYDALNEDQRATLGQFGTLVHNDLNTIETCGGGSARCMMAEIHLPRTEEASADS